MWHIFVFKGNSIGYRIYYLWKIKQSKLFAGVQLNIGFVWTFKDAYSSVSIFDGPVDRGAYDKTS